MKYGFFFVATFLCGTGLLLMTARSPADSPRRVSSFILCRYPQGADKSSGLMPPKDATPVVPDSVLPLLRRAQTFIRAGKFADALELLRGQEAARLTAPQEQQLLRLACAIVQVQWGRSLLDIGNYNEAYQHFGEAYLVDKDRPDRLEQATDDLINMGYALVHISRFREALLCYERAVKTAQEAGKKELEARAWNNRGQTYDVLRDYVNAISCYTQALQLRLEVKDRRGEATTRSNLGSALGEVDRFLEAVNEMESAGKIFHELGDRSGEATVLSNLGAVYVRQRRFAEAKHQFQQALEIRRVIGDQVGEASTLNGLFYASAQMGNLNYIEFTRALEKAMRVWHSERDVENTATVLSNLMVVWNARGNKQLATFYGKQAVAAFQMIRNDSAALEKDTQKRYIAGAQPAYRQLAAILCEQGRLQEAIQTLNLLQQEEYLNFNPRIPGLPDMGKEMLKEAPLLTLREAIWGGRIAQAVESLAALNFEQRAQQAHPASANARQSKLPSLAVRVQKAQTAYANVLIAATADFSHPKDSKKDSTPVIPAIVELVDALKKLGKGTAIIYTLTADDGIYTLLALPNRFVLSRIPVSLKSVREKIARFRLAVIDPVNSPDPRRLGKELYDLILKGIEDELKRVHIQALLFALDGPLKQLPIAALSPDGQRYLVQHYALLRFTAGGLERLMRPPRLPWRALAAAASQRDIAANLPALPGAPKMVRDLTGAEFFLGHYLLDAEKGQAFTLSSLKSALAQRPSLVHLDSHFVLGGQDENSYLRLGDGTRWTLAQIKKEQNDLFQGVELLTLSACSTGSEPDSASTELENIATLAQRKGADPVCHNGVRQNPVHEIV